jgi:hypothetical protein
MDTDHKEKSKEDENSDVLGSFRITLGLKVVLKVNITNRSPYLFV